MNAALLTPDNRAASGLSTTVHLTISSDQASYNIFTAAGSPAGTVNVILTIENGFDVTFLDTGTGWASGSTVKIINNGHTREIDQYINVTIDNTNGRIGDGSGPNYPIHDHAIYTVVWLGGFNSSQFKRIS